MRDGVLASAAWEANAGLGASEEEARLLGALENLFPINNEGALSNVLDGFWNSWSDLADNPTDHSVRIALHSRATHVTSLLNRISQDLDLFEDDAILALNESVDEFNGILEEVAALNESIQASRAKGTPDLVAEDRRDKLVGDLSLLTPVRIKEESSGAYTLTVDGMTLVQESEATRLVADTTASPPTLSFSAGGVAYSLPPGDDGKLGAQIRTLQTTLPGLRQSLDELAAVLVDRVNTLHAAGYGLDGATGRNFFDPAGVTAGSIALSADISDPINIAASDDPDPTAQGDSDVARLIAAERTALQAGLSGETVESFAINILGDLGARVEQANGRFESNLAVANFLQAVERGSSGVSVDEELTRLIQQQQTFGATARVLSTAQQMIDTLLSL